LDGLLICLALSHIRSELGCTESLIVFAELEQGVGLGAAEHIGICNIDFNWLQGPSPLYQSLSEAPLNSCLNLISTLSGLVRSSSIASSSLLDPSASLNRAQLNQRLPKWRYLSESGSTCLLPHSINSNLISHICPNPLPTFFQCLLTPPGLSHRSQDPRYGGLATFTPAR
jgi:hypothetical protein